MLNAVVIGFYCGSDGAQMEAGGARHLLTRGASGSPANDSRTLSATKSALLHLQFTSLPTTSQGR